jgi:hypothetical protein
MNDRVLVTAAAACGSVLYGKPLPIADDTRDAMRESGARTQLLATLSSAEPSTLREAVEIARKLFKADAAGLHVRAHDTSGSVTRAEMIAGALSMHEGARPMLGYGLYKRAVQAGAPIVLSQQEIELTYLRNIEPRVVHVLMAPIYDDAGNAFAVIWLAQITSPITYSRVDTLALEQLTYPLAARLTAFEKDKQLSWSKQW